MTASMIVNDTRDCSVPTTGDRVRLADTNLLIEVTDEPGVAARRPAGSGDAAAACSAAAR